MRRLAAVVARDAVQTDPRDNSCSRVAETRAVGTPEGFWFESGSFLHPERGSPRPAPDRSTHLRATGETIVGSRPTLGTMPFTRRGVWWWLPVGVDLALSSATVAIVILNFGKSPFPAIPITPF